MKEQEKKVEKLTDAKIKEWKKKWGKIYKTTIGQDEYIWRRLKRKEYVNIISDGYDDEEGSDKELRDRIYRRQEEITKTVVLHPSNIEELIEDNAGLATAIADEVILRSGFDVVETEEL